MSHSGEGSERRLFDAALNLDGEARESFLREIALENAPRARRLRALLAAHEQPGLESRESSWFEPSNSAADSSNTAPLAATRLEPRVVPSVPAAGPERLQPGVLLAGRYRIAAFLDKGGMGEVYRAEDETLGGELALKVVAGSAADPRRLALFLSEVRIARQVSHPHVCRVHDVGESHGLRFMTMELIDGENLAALMARSGPLEILRAIEIGTQLCDGLGAMHEKGILHRDVKPTNVMLGVDGLARLADFGLAGLAGDSAPGGTPAYMAPELWTGAPATVQSELYALGLILYELFTGQRPFAGSTTAELRRQHLEQAPPPPTELRSDLPSGIAETILCCLRKEPGARPLSTAAVTAALRGGEVPAEAGWLVRARVWTPPPLPAEPYPVLLPYRHRPLFSGRDGEIERLCAWLELPRPIVGLSAPSGTGKSSLLTGGLYPELRETGQPAVIERHPADPGLAGRLAGGLLEAFGGIALADGDHAGFIALLDKARSLAGGVAPVLIVDQLEDLFRRGDAGRARAVLGTLLAATCRRRPGQDGPPCRWLLAYREEYSGQFDAWLRDVLQDAERLGLDAAGLPRDLSSLDRFQAWPLEPLGAPAKAATEALAEATAIFRRVIEAPLELDDETGRRRYPVRFAGDGAERLARAFAEARLAQPRAPLAPDLQVVLAYLLGDGARDGESGGAFAGTVIHVPVDVGQLIDRALEDHLRRALETAFPAGRGAAQGRARALLALRELAASSNTRGAALPEAALERAIGPDGRQVLETLAGPAMRLVVPEAGPNTRSYHLAHDRLAEVVTRLVEEEGRSGGLVIDSELLAMRRRIDLQSALHAAGEQQATALPGREFRRIEKHAEALLWGPGRRTWWAACRRRRRALRWRRAAWASAALITLLVLALSLRSVVEARAARRATLEQIAEAAPEAAAAVLVTVLDDAVSNGTTLERGPLVTALGAREQPFDLLELGLAGLPPERRGELILQIGELALPLLEPAVAAGSDDAANAAKAQQHRVRLASLLWALDYAPMRDPALAARAQELRDRALAPLWATRPPPTAAGERWVDLPGGTFWMGAAPGELADDDFPLRQVTVTPFQMLAHEVTHGEYRRLVPEHPGESGDENLPVSRVSWYAAMVYAAWLDGPGGWSRLPTEAEWEHAVRAGCEHAPCTADGAPAELEQVAWGAATSADESGENRVSPVASLEPSPYGLYDLLGNVWEWIADWSWQVVPTETVDPVGPPIAEPRYRLLSGGSAFVSADYLHPAVRAESAPELEGRSVGFRPVRAARPR